MAYTLSNLLQDLYKALGQSYTTTASDAGSISTAIDTKLGELYDDVDFEDGGIIIIVRDAGGASAAPEGEFSNITAYAQDSNTFTFSPEITVAVGAGDTFMVCRPTFPLYEMIEACNRALQDLGTIALVDTSLTTATSQTEYDLPVALKYKEPLRIQLQGITTDSDDNRYHTINPGHYRITPAAGGSTGLLTLPQYPSGYTLKIWYEGIHPKLTAYSSVVHETVHPKLAVAASKASALEWYNTRIAGTNPFWANEGLKAQAALIQAKREFPVWKPKGEHRYLLLDGGEVQNNDFKWPDPA